MLLDVTWKEFLSGLLLFNVLSGIKPLRNYHCLMTNVLLGGYSWVKGWGDFVILFIVYIVSCCRGLG